MQNVHAGVEIGVVLSGDEERTSPTLLARPCGDVWLVPPGRCMETAAFGTVSRVLRVIFLPEFLGETG